MAIDIPTYELWAKIIKALYQLKLRRFRLLWTLNKWKTVYEAVLRTPFHRGGLRIEGDLFKDTPRIPPPSGMLWSDKDSQS